MGQVSGQVSEQVSPGKAGMVGLRVLSVESEKTAQEKQNAPESKGA